MNIFLTGATGFIGQHILKACLEQGHRVTACVRDTKQAHQRFPTAQFIEGNFATDHATDDWLLRLTGIDIVINTAGIIQQRGTNTFDAIHRRAACALFQACEQNKIKKIIQISALGADDTAFSEYHLSKKAADDYLTQLTTNWIIFMPSIVYGPGAKSMALFTAMAALPWTPLIDKGHQAIQPIHVDDLVRAILATITSNTIHHCRLEVPGPKAITLKTLLTLLKAWLGMDNKAFIPVPYNLVLALAPLSRIFGNTPVSPDTVKMLNHSNTANVQPFINLFGFSPVSFETALLQQPALVSDIVYAKHYFLLPLLRITLAALWIITGIISAFVYPLASSYVMLAQVGVPEHLAPLALYAAAGLDFGLGVALLVGWHLRHVVLLQVWIIVTYSIIIAIGLPELWIDPFGPITKNIPLLVATLMLLATEK